MLYAFGFERVGVVVGDLYFVNPRAARGQEGAEHGVRLELRMLDRGTPKGSAYSAQPIAPEIVEVTRGLLEKVRSGELGHPPRDEPESSGVVRAGWL
jgi:hypothetical protein